VKFPTGAIATSIIPEHAPLVRELMQVLRQEIAIHRRHAEMLRVEEAAIVAFKVDTVNQSTVEREGVVGEMEFLAQKRNELTKQFPNFRGKKLSELIATNCHPNDSAKLLPLIEEFKKVATTVRGGANSTGQLAQFALNLVNGSISIFKGASQNIVKSYSARGALVETAQPAHASAQNSLRQV
jgi:hypothetical protein